MPSKTPKPSKPKPWRTRPEPENVGLLAEVNRTPERPRMVVIVSDIHVPYHCEKAVNAFFDFLKETQPDEVVLNGDVADMHGASLHGDSLSENLLQEEIGCVNNFLDTVQQLAPQARIHYVEGNHEERLTRYIERRAPNMRGMTSVPELLGLNERGIGWTPYGKVHFLSDKVGCTHGTLHGTNYARDTLVKYGMSLFVGHAHRPAVATMGVAGKDSDTVRGVFGCGCLIPVDSVPYMKGPTSWTQGFGVCYIMPDGTFTPYLVNMAKGRFVWGGKIYG